MPLRPFPYPFGVGVDIVHVPRIRRIISKDSGPSKTPHVHVPSPRTELWPRPRLTSLQRFLRRVLTQREEHRFWTRFGKRDDEKAQVQVSITDEIARHLAGRWAAKEAVIKAVTERNLSFMDIEIAQHPSTTTGSGGIYAIILDQPGRSIEPAPTASHNAEFASTCPSWKPEQTNVATLGQDNSIDLDLPPSGQAAQISISHDEDYSTAICLAPTQSSF